MVGGDDIWSQPTKTGSDTVPISSFLSDCNKRGLLLIFTHVVNIHT